MTLIAQLFPHPRCCVIRGRGRLVRWLLDGFPVVIAEFRGRGLELFGLGFGGGIAGCCGGFGSRWF